ncbi:hypothetical protein [Streptomyces sp. CA-106110]
MSVEPVRYSVPHELVEESVWAASTATN